MRHAVDLKIYSPRWDYEDTYSVTLDQAFMEITAQTKTAKATWAEKRAPEWSGVSIQSIMRDDLIYPPVNTQDFFERVWIAWRDDELNNDEAEKELRELAMWINTTTHAKPKTDFWNQYF